jgi:hypothetical protein
MKCLPASGERTNSQPRGAAVAKSQCDFTDVAFYGGEGVALFLLLCAIFAVFCAR